MVLLLFSNNNVEKNACQLAEKLYLFPKNADRPNIVFIIKHLMPHIRYITTTMKKSRE